MIILSVSTALYLLAVAFRVPFITGTPEYSWSFRDHFYPAGLWITLATAAIYLGASMWALCGKARVWRKLAAIVIAGVIFQLGIFAMNRDGMGAFVKRVYGYVANSYFIDAARIKDLRGTIEHYDAVLPKLGAHSSTHPPGTLLFFWSFVRCVQWFPPEAGNFAVGHSHQAQMATQANPNIGPSEALAAWLTGIFIMVGGIVGAILAFLLGKAVYGEEAGIMAAAIWAVIPAMVIHTPIIDQIYALINVAGVYLMWVALSRRSWPLALASGLLGSLGLFMTYAFQAFPFLILLLFILKVRRDKASGIPWTLRQIALVGGAYAAGQSVVVALFLSFWGFTGTIKVWETGRILRDIVKNIVGRKTTWMWMVFDPYEFMAWLALPVGALFLLRAYRSLKTWRHPDEGGVFAIAVSCWLALIFLSGQTMYEAGRTLLFASPLAVIIGVGEAREKTDRPWFIAGILALVLASTIVFAALFF